MPELPEVETTRRGIYPHIIDTTITNIVHSGLNLRKPLLAADKDALIGHKIANITRRGKYLILHTNHLSLDILLHLGMSGSLRVIEPSVECKKHDHVIITLDNKIDLRYHDPRRFGFVSAFNREEEPKEIALLGVEPLSDDFHADYLYRQTRGIKRAIKDFIMDQKKVVGVGNIYATEALFMSLLHPQMAAETLTIEQSHELCQAIKAVLAKAIDAGGTTLRDFVQSDGKPGYFKQTLQVYARAGQPCYRCGETIIASVVGGRKSAFCPHCQAK